MIVATLVLLWTLPTNADRRIWRVRSGDALSVLAERFDVTVEDLREWNDLESDAIRVGQELVVAGGSVALPDGAGPLYTVVRGDTLSHIAARHGTRIEELLRLNPGLRPDRLRAGQTLRVTAPEGRQRIDYRVREGDTLARIAARHRVEVREILRWNPRLRPDHIRAGQTVVVWSEIPESVSESIGAPNHGRLENAEVLPPHPGYIVRNRNRAYGTLETILWIQDAFDAVRAQHPGAPRVRIHDISLPAGGPMAGHRSHQSGRDVDMSYFQRRCGGLPCPMRRLNPEDLDADRQWTLFEHWLKNDQVDAIFMDYSLQRPLYEAARRAGYSRTELSRWIQYPRGPSFPLGIVRHYRRHRDHAHVRFTCPDTDETCRR